MIGPRRGKWPRCIAWAHDLPKLQLRLMAEVHDLGVLVDRGARLGTLFGRGARLEHYLVEVHDSGTVWPRFTTRTLFGRDGRLEHCLAEVHDSSTVLSRCMTQALLYYIRARPWRWWKKLDSSERQSCQIGLPGLGKRQCDRLDRSRGISFFTKGEEPFEPESMLSS
ncbi:hypothetical protein B296_00009334 [Ensete ventricosum]|uniref:Uncharacterized protein n=1 Tax=Ensete ventricosum TaxID=4639 RepID=A0A427AAF2_ENSVE|nr:hypothetical protein B296_00009334 [Ensete ventricosum]